MTKKPADILQQTSIHRSNDDGLTAELYLIPKTSATCSYQKPGRAHEAQTFPFRFVPLKLGGDGLSHVVSDASRELVEQEVSYNDIEAAMTSFYENAFADQTLDRFIHSHGDPHASRFAKWIIAELSGSTVWDDDCRTRNKKPVVLADGSEYVVHDRNSAHFAAVHSPKRPKGEVGRYFQLDECRVWMRLHFWALRESGIMSQSPSFADYYLRFTAHFVRIYQPTAPHFARESFRWSENPRNIAMYINDGRVMKDVLGLSLEEAQSQIPANEAFDSVWPYNKD